MLKEPQRDETPTSLFNPLFEDFTVQRADDDNVVHSYTLHSQEIETFPAYIANHIKRKLAEKIYVDKYPQRTKESIMPEILAEIEVHL